MAPIQDAPLANGESFLLGALAVASTLPEPSSSVYTAKSPSISFPSLALSARPSALPHGPLAYSPLAHSLLKRQARSHLTPAPSPLRLAEEAGQLGRQLAQQAEKLLADVATAASDHVADVARALATLGEALRLPLPTPAEWHQTDADSRSDRSGRRLSRHLQFAAVIPGDSVAELVVTQGVFNFLNIYNTLLVVRLVLTWFPNPPAAIVSPLATICDPYLNLFRGIIPPLGGTLDFSPILAFLVLNVFTNAAAAIPAEIPAGIAAGEEGAVDGVGSAAGRELMKTAAGRRQLMSLLRQQRQQKRQEQ